MTSPARGPVRAVRVGVFAGAAVGLSLAAHVAGGGVAPSMTVLSLLLLLTATGTLALAGRRCSPVVIVGALGTAQFALHHAYAFFAPVAGCVPSLSGGSHLHHEVSAAACAPAASMAMHGTSPAMLLAHAAATVLTAGLLSRGERLLWRVVEQFLPVRPSAVPALPARAIPRVPGAARPFRPSVVPPGGVGRRGPPSWPAATA